MELKHKLEEYRNTTLELIEALEKEEFNSLQQLLNKRQALIEEISTLNYSQEEFKEACDFFNILKLQYKLNSLMKEKQIEIKEKINNNMKEKNANKAYNSAFYTPNRFLNKKI